MTFKFAIPGLQNLAMQPGMALGAPAQGLQQVGAGLQGLANQRHQEAMQKASQDFQASQGEARDKAAMERLDKQLAAKKSAEERKAAAAKAKALADRPTAASFFDDRRFKYRQQNLSSLQKAAQDLDIKLTDDEAQSVDAIAQRLAERDLQFAYENRNEEFRGWDPSLDPHLGGLREHDEDWAPYVPDGDAYMPRADGYAVDRVNERMAASGQAEAERAQIAAQEEAAIRAQDPRQQSEMSPEQRAQLAEENLVRATGSDARAASHGGFIDRASGRISERDQVEGATSRLDDMGAALDEYEAAIAALDEFASPVAPATAPAAPGVTSMGELAAERSVVAPSREGWGDWKFSEGGAAAIADAASRMSPEAEAAFLGGLNQSYRSKERNTFLQGEWDAGRRQGMVQRPADNSNHLRGEAMDINWGRIDPAYHDEIKAALVASGWGEGYTPTHWDFGGRQTPSYSPREQANQAREQVAAVPEKIKDYVTNTSPYQMYGDAYKVVYEAARPSAMARRAWEASPGPSILGGLKTLAEGVRSIIPGGGDGGDGGEVRRVDKSRTEALSGEAIGPGQFPPAGMVPVRPGINMNPAAATDLQAAIFDVPGGDAAMEQIYGTVGGDTVLIGMDELDPGLAMNLRMRLLSNGFRETAPGQFTYKGEEPTP